MLSRILSSRYSFGSLRDGAAWHYLEFRQGVQFSAHSIWSLHGDGQSGCKPGKQEGSLFAQPESLGYTHCCSNVNVYEGCNKILN